MQTDSRKNQCASCGKGKAVSKCEGCSQDFCYNHFLNHREELSKQFDEVENNRDFLRQKLIEQETEPQKYASTLIQQVDKWECNSIKMVRRAAEEARQTILKHAEEHSIQVESQLNELTDQLRQYRQRNDFLESDLQKWKQELIKLSSQSSTLLNVTIREELTPLVTTIQVQTCGNISFYIFTNKRDKIFNHSVIMG